MGCPRLRINRLVKVIVACKWFSWNLNPGLLRAYILNFLAICYIVSTSYPSEKYMLNEVDLKLQSFDPLYFIVGVLSYKVTRIEYTVIFCLDRKGIWELREFCRVWYDFFFFKESQDAYRGRERGAGEELDI